MGSKIDDPRPHSGAFAHAHHVSVTPAIRNRKSHLSNIWLFDSPKNDRRFVIEGDVAFMHFVLMEGNREIARYDPDPAPVNTVIDGEPRQTKLDAIVYFSEGDTEWWEFKRANDAGPNRSGRARAQLSAQAQCASLAGVKYRVLTDIDLRDKQILFDNWLLLCAAMTRAKRQPVFREARLLEQRLDTHRAVTVGALLEDPAADAGLMLAVIAKALQQGRIRTDLDQTLIAKNSVLEWGPQ
jgi:hypothetical protein